MKPIRRALIDYLLAQAPVAAVVGTRVFPIIRPQSSALPALSVEKASAGHEPSMDSTDTLPSPQFVVTSWANTVDAADSLAGLVLDSLKNVGPENWTPGADTVRVTAVTFLDETDSAEEKAGGNDEWTYGIRQIYEIQYEEA
jgi:hypothetical protein